ncbi:radical SAM protein [Nanoarchaeota archaeon]
MATQPIWVKPAVERELGEIKRTAHFLDLDASLLIRLFRESHLESLDAADWSILENCESIDGGAPTEERQEQTKHKREFGLIQEAMHTGGSVPAPSVLFRNGYRPCVVAGNTRLLACRTLNIPPQILALRMESFPDINKSSVPEYIQRIRVLLTENCNSNCPHCFNKDIRTKKHMESRRAMALFDYLSKHTSELKIMGGEPTVHPDFRMLYEYAQKRFSRVGLFTNAVNEEILNVKPRETDSITYNLGLINRGFDYDKVLPKLQFNRTFETMVGAKTDIDGLFSKIDAVIDACREKCVDRMKFNVTLNCVENIFENKDLLNKRWVAVVDHIIRAKTDFLSFDHKIPLCFWTRDSIDFIKRSNLIDYFNSTCRPGDYGLINSDFELLHCNQHPIKIARIFKSDEDDSPIISFNRLNTLLFKANMEKLVSNLSHPECIDCRYAIVKCTGGCFRHKY